MYATMMHKNTLMNFLNFAFKAPDNPYNPYLIEFLQSSVSTHS